MIEKITLVIHFCIPQAQANFMYITIKTTIDILFPTLFKSIKLSHMFEQI